MDFCVEDGDSWGTGVAGIVKKVAAGGEADAMGFSFLWADVADKISVGCFAAGGDEVAADGEERAGAFDALVGRAIGADTAGEKAAELVGIAGSPDGCVRAMEKLVEGGKLCFLDW